MIYRDLKKQGVVFTAGFHLWSDLVAFDKVLKDNPCKIDFSQMIRNQLKCEVVPSKSASIIMGIPYIALADVDYLQDLYVNKNQFIDRHDRANREAAFILDKSIFFRMSADPKTAEKRKALSGAFFKSKLVGMTKIIKQTALDVIRETQANMVSGEQKEINLAELTFKMQSQMIFNVLVGYDFGKRTCMYEDSDGMKEVSLVEMCDKTVFATYGRITNPFNTLIPGLMSYLTTPSDFRWKRNIDRYHDTLKAMIKERQADKEQMVKNFDMLSILSTFEQYQG